MAWWVGMGSDQANLLFLENKRTKNQPFEGLEGHFW